MSRRAIKRFEQQQVLEANTAASDQNEHLPSSDDDDKKPTFQNSPRVKAKQSLFALLGDEEPSDPEDAISSGGNDHAPDDDQHPDSQQARVDPKAHIMQSSEPAPVATVSKKKRRKKRKGKRNGNALDPENDPDWIALNEYQEELAAEAQEAQSSTAIPVSFFNSEDDDEVREEAQNIMKMIEDMVLPSQEHDNFPHDQASPSILALLVEPKLLNADAELKRLFGAKVVESERRAGENTSQATRNRARAGPRAHLRRKVSIVSPRDTWFDRAPGLLMQMDREQTNAITNTSGLKYFRYAHESSYARIQNEYRALVNMHDPNFLMDFSNRNPFHVDALLQLAELYRQMGELERAGEWIERCLYVLEGSWILAFKPYNGSCRLRFDVLENRSLYIALFRYSQLLTRRGLHRTALEMSKLILNFDPDSDPMGMLMLADSYALLSGEYKWVQDMRSQYEFIPLKYFPNFALSEAIATECLRLGMSGIANRGASSSKSKKRGKGDGDSKEEGDDGNLKIVEDLLVDAILTFPMIVKPLLIAIQDSSKVWQEHQLFDEPWYSAGYNDGGVLMRMSRVYAERSKLIWNSGHNKDILVRCARRAGVLDTAAGIGKDEATGLMSSAFVSDEVEHERVARCRALRVEAAVWLRESRLYQNVQIADFADSTTDLPAEILAGDGAEQTIGAQQPREVSVARGALEFIQSLLPWREARDARDDEEG